MQALYTRDSNHSFGMSSADAGVLGIVEDLNECHSSEDLEPDDIYEARTASMAIKPDRLVLVSDLKYRSPWFAALLHKIDEFALSRAFNKDKDKGKDDDKAKVKLQVARRTTRPSLRMNAAMGLRLFELRPAAATAEEPWTPVQWRMEAAIQWDTLRELVRVAVDDPNWSELVQHNEAQLLLIKRHRIKMRTRVRTALKRKADKSNVTEGSRTAIV